MYETRVNENNQSYKYDAFISYRHTELDSFVAEKIQKYLEEFKLPKKLKGQKKLKKTKIQRVFRDKEELTITNNLEDPIIQALRETEYLIVICSPRIKESIWCRKEIETFIQFHGRQKILTVLIEGEPADSFPEELLYEDEIVKENGIASVHRKNIEPLAADIRGNSKKEISKKLKSELLRLIAPVFGLEYDDLRQRHRERKIRRIVTATAAAAIVGAVIGVAGITSALVINNQNKKIEEQNAYIETQNTTLLHNQAINFANNSLQLLSQDRRIEAIEQAVFGITEYEGIKMPYTPEAKYALIKALRVYDNGEIYKAQNQFIGNTKINEMRMSPGRVYMMARDVVDNLYVWDISTDKLVLQLENVYIENVDFLGDYGIVYSDDNEQVKVVYFENIDNIISIEGISGVSTVQADISGEHIAISNNDGIKIYNVSSDECELLHEIETKMGEIEPYGMIWADNKLIYSENQYIMVDGVEQIESLMHIFDINTGNIISIAGDYYSIDKAKFFDGVLYIAVGLKGDNEGKNGCILAVDEITGEILWQNNYNDGYVSNMYIARLDGKKYVIASSYGYFYCLNADDGANLYVSSITEGIADLIVSQEGIANILTYKGTFINYNIRNNHTYSFDYILESNIGIIGEIKICLNGYVALPMRSNYIIKYNMTEHNDIEKIDVSDDVEDEFVENIYVNIDFREEAREIGIEKYNIVDGLCYIENGKIALVRYSDARLDVYDVQKKKTLKTIEDVRCPLIKELDVDADGNIYVLGEEYGYCFDKDYNLIAEVEDMITVDVDEGYMLVGNVYEEAYKIPIYSLDELIDMANELIK